MRWVLAVLVAVGLIVGSLNAPSADGYILFTPPTGASPLVMAEDAGIRLESCMSTAGGLEVRGHVWSASRPVQIVVTPSAPPGAGVRVGFSLAASVPQFQGAVPGDFKVVIPWATGDSRFMIVSAPVNNMAGGDDTVGVVEKVGTECPAASPP